MTATLHCDSDAARRAAIRARDWNGIDAIEVDCAQTTLIVTFIGRVPEWIGPENLRIEGGRRERDIRVLGVAIERAEDEGLDDRLFVTLDRPGDFSTYRLVIVVRDENGRATGETPPDFDIRYASAEFSFKAGCPQDQDPADCPPCIADPVPAPAIDYLAKDYQGFRRLMLDRLALTMPEWKELHVPDLGITLVELFAYVADDLSYYQDAVATEAFLDSARLRESVRRHCRLVDYRLHDGCAARTWAAFELDGADTLEIDTAALMLTTALPGDLPAMLRGDDIDRVAPSDYLAFEPAETGTLTLRQARNRIAFYDWGQSECCLVKGATSATLVDPVGPPPQNKEGQPGEAPDGALALAAGDVLLFAEMLGAHTHDPADADPARRHAVRLTAATRSHDPLTDTALVEIEWCAEDALPFALCLSSRAAAPDCEWRSGVSVAFGNVIAVDHGRSVEQALPPVAARAEVQQCETPCAGAETRHPPARYRPRLDWPGLSFVAGTSDEARCGGCGGVAASARGVPDPVTALPAITLQGALAGEETAWTPRLDLIDSGPRDAHFVVETGADGVATLRFGDGICGRLPEAGESFVARYRIGNGTLGNIGAGALRHLVFRDAFPDGVSIAVTNPLPARGGTAPEAIADAKLRAPRMFRTRLERAIAPQDYADIAMRDFPGIVQRAAATLRASGVRREVQVAIDTRGSADPSRDLLDCIAAHLRRYARIGHDVRVVPARYVPIDLAIRICVARGHIAEQVGAAARAALGAGRDRAGKLGFFHPDALSFGEGVMLSRILAAVHGVEGVAHADIVRFERLFEGPDGEIDAGILRLGPTEIARLDQDRDAPEHGRLLLALLTEGGR